MTDHTSQRKADITPYNAVWGFSETGWPQKSVLEQKSTSSETTKRKKIFVPVPGFLKINVNNVQNKSNQDFRIPSSLQSYSTWD